MKNLLLALCFFIATFGFQAAQAQFTVDGPATICTGSPVTLTATNCGGTLKWSTGETTASITVSPAVTTTYYVTCTVGNASTTGSLSPIVVPGLQLNSNVGNCFIDQSILSVSGVPSGSNLRWEKDGILIPGAGGNSYTATQSGTYSVKSDIASSAWTWQNLLPDGEDFNDIFFATDFIGVAVGNYGKIVRTTDGGQTWTKIAANASYDFTSLHFVSGTTGWLVTNGGQLLKTTDAGLTWNQYYLGGSYYRFNEVFFTDLDHGWITDGNSGSIIRTTDGGVAWQSFSTGIVGLTGVHFTDNNNGWAVGFTIKKTTDGGVTWNTVNYGNSGSLKDVFFVDPSRGWIVGSNSIIYKTTDGGSNWTSLSSSFPPFTNFTTVFFTDQNNGMLLAWNGIYKSSNGGNSWNLTEAPAIGAQAVFMRSPNRAWVAGLFGRLLTGYAGSSAYAWKITRGEGVGADQTYSGSFPALDFVNADYGWAANGRSFLMRTTNGGRIWTNTSLKDIYDVDFVDVNTGFAAAKGTLTPATSLYKSTDGGNSWNPVYTFPGSDGASIQFLNSNVGWAVANYNNPNVYRTTNGGNTWSTTSPGFSVTKLFFLDASNGWVGGADGKVAKTTDGGVTWTNVNAGTESANFYIDRIYFKDSNIGWITGSKTRRTTNGGLTWSDNVVGGYSVSVPFSSISFYDADHGFALSLWRNPNGGVYYFKTSDGGLTWTQQVLPSSISFGRLVLNDAANGWVTSGQGAIMHYAAPTATCAASLALQQSPPAPMVTASTHNALCEGESITLTASGCPDALSWSDGSVGATITVTPYASTTYTASCGGSNGCKGATYTGVAVTPKIRLDTASAAPCNRPVFSASNYFPSMDVIWKKDGTILPNTNGPPGRLESQGAGTYTAESGATGAWAPQLGAYSPGTFTDVTFATPLVGFAVSGQGTILKTSDGGVNWKTMPSGTTNPFERIETANEQVAWALNTSSTLFKTTDGGNSWKQQKIGSQSTTIEVSFASTEVGWAVSHNEVFHTTDGGTTWALQLSGSFSAIQAINSTTAWVIGGQGLVMKTTDGGATWNNVEVGIPPNQYVFLQDLTFSGAFHGWIIGSNNVVLHTSDGGSSWEAQSLPLTGYSNFTQIQFADNDHGWIKIEYGNMLKTVDGGQNWTKLPALYEAGFSGASRFFMGDANLGVLAGNGFLARTVDGAATWQNTGNGLLAKLVDIQFVNNEKGFAIGADGLLLSTTNGGRNWTIRRLSYGLYSNSIQVYFADELHGWIIGNENVMLRTNDGGVSWIQQSLPNGANNFYKIYFVSPLVGWAVGSYPGKVYKTADGGVSWTLQNTPANDGVWQSLFFVDANQGWVIGGNGSIIATSNGGATWTAQNSGVNKYLTSVYFTDSTNGWIVSPNLAGLLHTIDGGITWTNVSLGQNNFGFPYQVQFLNENEGFARTSGLVYATKDGGNTWQKSYPYEYGGNMYFTDLNHGWVVGNNGILSYHPAAAPCPSAPIVVQPQSIAPLSTLNSGNWDTPSVWSCGLVPTILDNVRINVEHTITLPDDYAAKAKSVDLRGQIQYNANANLQMGQD